MFLQVWPTLKSLAKLSSKRRNGHPTEHRQRDNIDSERTGRKLRAGLVTALDSITSIAPHSGSIPTSLQLIKVPGKIQPSLKWAVDLSTAHCSNEQWTGDRHMPSSVLGVYVFIKVAPLLARSTCKEREKKKKKKRKEKRKNFCLALQGDFSVQSGHPASRRSSS